MTIGPGSQLDGYEVVTPLGRGGMGEVWLGRDLALNRPVALKFLSSEFTRDAARVTRFRQEARAASGLNHPNVCTIHALGETDDGQQFIAMEHIAGDTLRHRLAGPPLALAEAIDIAAQVASALSVAHAAGVVHRDLKPENVMLRPDGLVKLVDFGLAKLTSAPDAAAGASATISGVRTDAGTVVGTMGYMSPEQARGQETDARTDIWSLGVMLYEMIAGRSPFDGQSGADALAAILGRDPAPIVRFQPDAPPELQRIVAKTLRKDREQRYQVMKDLLLDLQALRQELLALPSGAGAAGVVSPRQETPAAAVAAPAQSSAEYVIARLARYKAGAAIVLVIAVVAAVAWAALSSRRAVPGGIPSVAVLPFRTIGGGDQYFADGITEAVTTELGRVGGLRVIASNSTYRYRDQADLAEIVRDLGVGLVVRGSVQRAGGTVRIDVSLVDAHDVTALWSEHYSRDAADVLAVQDDISRQIAGTLSKTFGAAPIAAPASLATRDPEAYDAYLRGLWHLKGRSEIRRSGASIGAHRVAAIEELERAVARDPNFALAHAALASAYTQRFFYDAPNSDLEQRAFAEIQRALTINPNQAEAYLARAQLSWTAHNGFPHERAVTDLRRALAINPNLADAHVELGKVYYHIGLIEEAVEATEAAQRLDPSQSAASSRLFRALTDAGRTEEVRAVLESRRPLASYEQADALVMLGRPDEALQVLIGSRDTSEQDPDADPGAIALLAAVYARVGRRADAERVLAAAIPTAENTTGLLSHVHHAQFHIGAALGLLGRPEEAMRWLTKATNEGYPSYTRFSTDRNLDPLRKHPEFEALLARLRQQRDRWQKTL